ncbi:Arc family DNA-binding protein [Streptomyces sp. NPDC005480]|uniref:Arc family DNA-binding protein n=1 Tax=Streptomyces sp. NPDC005480 TaxID=3154880 RepID=UPI0033B57337
MTVRLLAELHERFAAQAKRDHRTVNSEMAHVLEVALADPSADSESPWRRLVYPCAAPQGSDSSPS